MSLGSVREIWRHPVKSMQGERVENVALGIEGIPGDRAWAVRDEVKGGIRGAKKIPALMRCSASLPDPLRNGDPIIPEIGLPNGDRIRADAADAATRVSEALGHAVTLWPLRPAEDKDHYRRGAPTHEDLVTELRDIFGRTPDEPLPNLGALPPELLEFESPPGSYFDAFPLLLLTDASLRRLETLAPASRIDVRRFRPNFVFDTNGAEGFVESGWAGRRLRLGGALLQATVPCPRCVMITHAFDDLPRDVSLMRTVVREADQCVGLYASVLEPGPVRIGDTLALAD